jgi:hypothetical protein
VILKSQTNLVCARNAPWSPQLEILRDEIVARIDAALAQPPGS